MTTDEMFDLQTQEDNRRDALTRAQMRLQLAIDANIRAALRNPETVQAALAAMGESDAGFRRTGKATGAVVIDGAVTVVA